MVDEPYVFGGDDVSEGNALFFFVDDAGDKAVCFRQEVEGFGFAGGVIGFADVGNLFQMFVVPLDGVHVVEGDAGGEDVHVGESSVVHCFFNDVHQVFAIDGIGLSHEGGAGGDGHGGDGQRGQGVSVRGGLGDEAFGGSGGCLAFGEAVDLVVEDQVGDVHISLHGMHGMAQADGVGVAVAGAYDEVGVFVGAFDALGEGKGPAVGGVGAVAVLVAADTGGAADAGNQGDVFIGPAFFGTDGGNSVLDAVVAAAGAPVWYDGIFIVSR